jgi:23S rRNA (cytosine1962-C5)-methyltransferase
VPTAPVPRVTGAEAAREPVPHAAPAGEPAVAVARAREPTAELTARGEQRLRTGHPWIYRSDVRRAAAAAGDIVRVVGPRGRPFGYATFSDRSVIALRLLTPDDARPDAAFWRGRIEAAVRYRETLGIDATAYRLIHGEGDRLPGLIVDRYGESLVVQTLTQATDRLLPELCDLLVDIVGPAGILARNDPRVRELEGLERVVELRHGCVPEAVEVREGAVRLFVDLWAGQKTGLFLDQQENRFAAARYARGRVLDGFCYTGAFALQMAAGCEAVLAVDVAESAVAAVARHAGLHDAGHVEARAGNVFDVLRELDRAGERFDAVVLDPPAFAKNRKAAERAAAGYKEINLRALRILAPGGTLVTSSCSYHVDEPAFARILAAAAADARADFRIVERRQQGRDHPMLVTVPETAYLKCFVLQKL